jgi:transcriptional antiterminator RfaH
MAFWACAQIDRRHEALSLHCLALSSRDVYQPRIKSRRRESEPLFSNYVFVAVEMQWHLIRWSPGVLKLIMAGDSPARIPDKIIAELKARERGGFVVLPKPVRPNGGGAQFQRGDQIRIARGAFSGLHGLVEGLRAHERVAILLQTFGRVELPANVIARV